MRDALNRIAATLTSDRADVASLRWELLRYQHTTALRSTLADRFAPATANKHLAALRGVLKEAWRLGSMTAEDYHRATDLPTVRGTAVLRGRALAHEELRALFEACKLQGGTRGARDAALLALAYGTGLRRAELVALDRRDYERVKSAITVRRGKGRTARVAYAARGARAAVDGWLHLRGTDEGPLFHPVNKSDRVIPRRMTAQAVFGVMRRLASVAGVSAFSPHDLRRTFISDLLDAGADIVTVQQLAGHANVQTTARYDRRRESTKQRAADLLDVPYAEKE